MPIVQHTIHTKLVITFSSGRSKVVYLSYELKVLTQGPLLDRNGVEHYINHEKVDDVEKSYINGEIE